jgi:hypothetical protein
MSAHLRQAFFDDFTKRILKDALNLEISRNMKEILYQFDNKKILFTEYVIVKERNYVNIIDEVSKSIHLDGKKNSLDFYRCLAATGMLLRFSLIR